MVRRIAHARQGGRRDSARGAHGQIRGIVDESPYLYEVEEDGRVDGTGSRCVVVRVRKRLEYLRRQLQPRAVERRDISPMSAEVQSL